MRTVLEIITKRIRVIDDLAYYAYIRSCGNSMTGKECALSPYILYMEPKKETKKEPDQRFNIYMKYIEKFSSNLFSLADTDDYSIYLKRKK